MYLDEKLINGILHYRTDPNGEWKPYTIEELSARIVKAEKRIHHALVTLNGLNPEV